MSLKEQFKILMEFFEREKLDYALIGAFALYAYGYSRATRDVDFITRGESQEIIVTFLESLGFETLNRSAGYSNHLHPIENMRFDLVYVEGDTARIIFEATSKKLVLDGMELPVVSPEHLIQLKLFAIRNDPGRKFKELADIRELIHRTPIDREKIREQFIQDGLEGYFDDIIQNSD